MHTLGRSLSLRASQLSPAHAFVAKWGILVLGAAVCVISIIMTVREKEDNYGSFAAFAAIVFFLTGIFSNRVATAWDKHVSLHLPAAREYFANQFLPRLVGIALAMVCRRVADDEPDPAARTSIRMLAKRFETDWGLLSQAPTSKRFFQGLDDRNLLRYIRNPRAHPLEKERWLDLFKGVTPEGQAELPADTRDRLVTALNARFGESFRLALERDFALGGEGSMGILIDVARELLTHAQPNPALEDNAAAIANAHRELGRSCRSIEGKLDRYHVSLRNDIASVSRSLDLIQDTTDETLVAVTEISSKLPALVPHYLRGWWAYHLYNEEHDIPIWGAFRLEAEAGRLFIPEGLSQWRPQVGDSLRDKSRWRCPAVAVAQDRLTITVEGKGNFDPQNPEQWQPIAVTFQLHIVDRDRLNGSYFDKKHPQQGGGPIVCWRAIGKSVRAVIVEATNAQRRRGFGGPL